VRVQHGALRAMISKRRIGAAALVATLALVFVAPASAGGLPPFEYWASEQPTPCYLRGDIGW